NVPSLSLAGVFYGRGLRKKCANLLKRREFRSLLRHKGGVLCPKITRERFPPLARWHFVKPMSFLSSVHERTRCYHSCGLRVFRRRQSSSTSTSMVKRSAITVMSQLA